MDEKKMASTWGVRQIAEERQRQIQEEGWTPEHDAEHTGGELVRAAVCYALPEASRQTFPPTRGILDLWPWAREWDKRPRGEGGRLLRSDEQTRPERIDGLTKAGALIAAELDRLLAEIDQNVRREG